MTFIRGKYPNRDPHHLLGSLGPLKVSDSLIAPLSREEHNKADVNREDYFLTYLPQAINLLQEYISYLEQELNSETL